MSAEFLTSEEEGVVGMAAGASGFEAVVHFATTSDEEEPKPSQVKTTVDGKKTQRHKKQAMYFQVLLSSKKPRYKHLMMACS
jgi:2-keto-4-pentenoate hydratase/2-oxohepta-3-ene-1,7-dioic acid hydratase in catechol pathway